MSERKSFKDGVQFAFDATSLELASTCHRKYYYSMIANIEPKKKSVHLIFGGIYAKALEHFYLYQAEGHDSTSALRAVVREAMIASWNHDLTPEGERIPGGEPISFDDAKKTRYNLIRSIVWYVLQFSDETEDGIRTHYLADGKPAVELSFTLEMSNDILYCGHLDRVVEYGGGTYWMDQKAQPLTSTVLTPTGFLPIGTLEVGQSIMGTDGSFHTVKGLHPKGITSCYRITTNDGAVTYAAGDHLWRVRRPQTKWRTITTPELVGKKWELPLLMPMQFPEADLPLDPYALGLLLGDGYLAGQSIQFSDKDGKEAAILATLIGGDKIKPASIHNNSWTISGGRTLRAIKALGLRGKLSAAKFIPECYLYSSIEHRTALLRGLIDTDGCRNGVSQLYDTTSEQLAKDICNLARSLGNTARYRGRSGNAFRCTFYGPSFGQQQRNPRIVLVEEVEPVETMCIEVSARNHLYITDDYIPTHNTTGAGLGPYYFDQFKPNNQFLGYTWAGKTVLNSPVRGGIIDAAQIAVGFTRFERSPITFTRAQIEEWHENSLWQIASVRAATMVNKFSMNLSACGNYGGCPFRKLCSQDPAVRENYILSDFVHRETPWDPIVPR